MNSLTVAGHGARLTITVYDYERIETNDPDDANWLNCQIDIATAKLTGKFSASLQTQDFHDFYRQLMAALALSKDRVVFQPLEDAIYLDIKILKTGTALVSGRTIHHGDTKLDLSFSFNSDLSYLGPALGELDKINRNFPIRD